MSKATKAAWAVRNREIQRIRALERRRTLAEHGICSRCQAHPTEPDRMTCSNCLAISREKAKENYKWVASVKDDRKRELIRLLGGSCKDCGYSGHFAGFEFDHVSGNKKHCISNMLNTRYKWEKILKEVAKCELVCATCHRIRTFRRLRGEICSPIQT